MLYILLLVHALSRTRRDRNSHAQRVIVLTARVPVQMSEVRPMG